MNIIWIYAVSLAVFLAVDAVWLRTVMYPLFQAHVGPLLRDPIRLEAALVFYLFYIAGVLYLATLPALRNGSLREAVINGGVIGFLAYGTYEATNMSTLKGWSWNMVVVDTGWGVFLTALTAAAGFYAAPYLGYTR